MFGSYAKLKEPSDRAVQEYDDTFRSQERKEEDYHRYHYRRQVNKFPSRRSPMVYRGKRKSSGTKQYERAMAMSKRRRVPSINRGYLRTAGYYGRQRGLQSGSWQELKFKDSEFEFSNVTTSGAHILLASDTNALQDLLRIPQSTGESGRIGRKVRLRSLEIRFTYRLGGNADNDAVVTIEHEFQTMRFIIVKDKQCNGANATYSEIFQHTGTVAVPTTSVFAFRNLEYKERFTVLYDRRFTLNYKTMAVTLNQADDQLVRAPVEMTKNIRINLKGTPIEYSALTGLTAERRTNNILIYAFYETNNHTNLSLHSRIRFDG